MSLLSIIRNSVGSSQNNNKSKYSFQKNLITPRLTNFAPHNPIKSFIKTSIQEFPQKLCKVSDPLLDNIKEFSGKVELIHKINDDYNENLLDNGKIKKILKNNNSFFKSKINENKYHNKNLLNSLYVEKKIKKNNDVDHNLTFLKNRLKKALISENNTAKNEFIIIFIFHL